MAETTPANQLFPKITRNEVLQFQFSSWYPNFAHISIKSSIIRPLNQDFCRYLRADGVFVPEGSEDTQVLSNTAPAASTLSDDEGDADSDEDEPREKFSFPELDEQIRKAIKQYGAVFPKLNFSSPKDASWVLPPSSPLKCTSPADVYLLIKSSDFISHDINYDNVFEHCQPDQSSPPYELELVLKKWYSVNPSREFRCFVREGRLIGISQRDMNFFDFLMDSSTQQALTSTVASAWQREIKDKWPTENYVFDILLTRDLDKFHIIDFNPYSPQTDPLLFSYEELNQLRRDANDIPSLRIIDSRLHPEAVRNAPANRHNMMPVEAFQMSTGRDIGEFAREWQQELAKAMDER